MKIVVAVLGLALLACGPKAAPQTAPRATGDRNELFVTREQARPTAEPSSKRSSPPPAARRSPPPVRKKGRVDCQIMCQRTFVMCVAEVLVASGKIDAKKVELIIKAGAMPKVQKAGFDACIKDCYKKKGFGSDAAEINRCLAETSCKGYAQCIKRHIK